MTKHAVVGLSTSLRCEAATYGVRVSAICPGFIDTPIVNATTYLEVDRDAVLASLPVALYPAERCAQDALRGVARNHAIILVTPFARIGWWVYRMAPRLVIRLARFAADRSPMLNRGPTALKS
jgi:NAD(P)-dependent dehydrogenase (short-subunit alcohol dehydrogenase family)